MCDEIERYQLLKQKLRPLLSFGIIIAKITLLRLFHVFSVSDKENNKSRELQELTTKLAKQSETDLYHMYNAYIDQLMTRRSMVSEEGLCIRKVDPYYEFQLKLCYGEKLIKQEKYKQYQEFTLKNKDFYMSTIKEMKTRKDYMTLSKSCIFLLHMLNIDKKEQHPGGSWNQEELACLLSDLLGMLPEANFYGTFEVYFEQVKMMNLAVRFEVMCTSLRRINPHLKLIFMLSYCEHLIKNKQYQLYRVWMVQNLKLFIDVTITVTNSSGKSRMGVPGVGTINSFEGEHIVGTPPLLWVGNPPFYNWLDPPLRSEDNRTIPHECDNPCDQINTQWNNEGYKIKKLLGLLSHLLSMLPEYEFDETITYYLLLVKNMKLDITPKYLHSVKTDPHLKLLFKLFWCGKLINEGYIDSYIVNRCLNDFCRENKAECTAQILSITDNLSEKSLLKEFLQCFLRKTLKTVTYMATRTHGNQGSGQNEYLNPTPGKSEQDLIYAHCACIYSGKKMKNVDINQYLRKLNMKGPEGENKSEMQSEQVKLLILFILLLLMTALGHKSAKLKKYLALKYEYDMACLYLLWCSGDIEVHPGPQWRTKQLEHNSERERKWLQDINSILLKLYWGKPTQSKPKNLWQKGNQPEQWPSDKPFYDTKNVSKDAVGNKITDDEILTCLFECLKKKEVDIPQIYQSEILAWTNKNIQFLHKLQVFRIEMERIKTASINLFLSNLEDDAKSLQNINVSLEKLTLDKMQIEGQLINDHRQKKQAEIVAEITRDLANTLCRLAKRTDPMEKGDGIWNTQPPVDWPDDVPFFNPKNRGKNKDKPKCPDTVLVCTFLKLQHLRIPENLQQIVDAYQTLFNCTETDRKKKNMEKLCRLYTVQSNWEKLDCSLHNLYKEGLFSREVHAILNQWWKTQLVDKHAEHVLKNTIVRSDERPHITIGITKVFRADSNLRHISYSIPLKDAYFHIKCNTAYPNQSSHEHTITGPFVPANSSENIEDNVLPPDVIDLVLEHDVVDQTECPNDNSVTDNISMPFDFQRQGTPLPIRHQHLTPHNDLDTLTTHNTLVSDLNGSRCTKEYDTTMIKAFDSVHSSNSRNGENLGGNMGTSKVKRKQLEDKEEPVKKLLKIKMNQSNGFSLELDPDSTSSLGGNML
ncbi:unnamed protein product [Mytilus edulis]|uniref:Uncharacterized protein n=1 Tax=Mytilus edulis TaxID=6550 RepID=A0A8S3TK75_MYTED|nr:unnamed protein product [Mytilus edulis]